MLPPDELLPWAMRRKLWPALVGLPVVVLFLLTSFWEGHTGSDGRVLRLVMRQSYEDQPAAARRDSNLGGAGSIVPQQQELQEHQQSKPGFSMSDRGVSRLWNVTNLSAAQHHTGNRSALCTLLMEPRVNCISVVGNGPLTAAQRKQIQRCERVARFNALNNKLPGERMDLWIVRHNYRIPHAYWGFWQFRYHGNHTDRVAREVAAARGVLFLGGTPNTTAYLLERYPQLQNKTFLVDPFRYQQLYTSFFTDRLERDLNTPDPSTGLLGLLALFGCVNEDTPVHIYGFNWSGKHYFTHQMGAEEAIVQQLGTKYNIMVHRTACQGLRACVDACDGAEFQVALHGEGKKCKRKTSVEELVEEKDAAEAVWRREKAQLLGPGDATTDMMTTSAWEIDGSEPMPGR